MAALEEGVITPASTFYCPGYYKNHGQTWYCWLRSGHGSVNVTTALEESCDVFFYNVGYEFYKRPGTELQDWAERLGLGKPTGIDLPGEYPGLVPTWQWRKQHFTNAIDKLWKPGNSINLAIGQGDLEATPLQMAVAYAAVANGGYVVTPHVGLKIVTPQGKLVHQLQTPRRASWTCRPPTCRSCGTDSAWPPRGRPARRHPSLPATRCRWPARRARPR